MKKCLGCFTTKFFVKLKNGLCPKCNEKYLICEKEYKDLLLKVSLPNQDIFELTNSIISLKQRLKEFDMSSNTIKSSDCDTLRNILMISCKNTTNIIKEQDNNINTSINISDQDSDFDDENIQDGPQEQDELQEKDISENTHNEDIEEKSVDEDEAKITLVREPIKTIDENINKDIYNESSRIINLLSDISLNIDDLCYYTFLLRDTYLPKLKKYKISEINGINIENLINSNISKASSYLNCKKEDLYSLYNYVSFSIQTTGLQISKNNILEISALKVKHGKIVDTFYTLINPNKTISLSIERSTGITNEMLKNAPYIDVALKGFVAFAEDLKLISHNINYSYGFIKYYYNHILGKQLKYKTEGIIRLYRIRYSHFHGEPPEKFDIYSCCSDILPNEDIIQLSNIKSKSMYESMASYKLYEILKNKYK